MLELLPVPARVLSQEESTDQMKLTLLFTQTQPWILLCTPPPPLWYLGTGYITRGNWTGPCDAPHGFLSQKGGMNNKLFVCFFFFNGVEEKTKFP